MVNSKKNSLIISTLVCALVLPLTGCYHYNKKDHGLKNHAEMKKDKEYNEAHRGVVEQTSHAKGEIDRKKMAGKRNAHYSVCKMCGAKTRDGKCVSCNK